MLSHYFIFDDLPEAKQFLFSLVIMNFEAFFLLVNYGSFVQRSWLFCILLLIARDLPV